MTTPDQQQITELQIRQVANGWEVINAGNYYSRRGQEIGPDQTWVFQDVPGMANWLTGNLKEPVSK